MAGFDPYLVWLDIPPHERPVNFYRLFGLRPQENDPRVIATAAERAIRHVWQFQQTQQGAACSQLLAELDAARACLLDPVRKQAYDRGMGMASGGERAIGPPLTGGTPQVRPAPLPAQSPYAPAGGYGAERPMSSPGAHVPASGFPASVAPRIGSPQPQPAAPSAAVASHGGVSPVAGRAQAPATAMARPAATTTPASMPASGLGGAAYAPHPTGGQYIPQGAHPMAPAPLGDGPLAYHPSAMPATAAAPASIQPPAMAYPQGQPPTAPNYPPSQPPAWAAGERSGQVTTMVAGAQPQQDASAERTQHRRIVRRQQQTSTAYMVVAFAIAMIVFFFGAVILLAIYLSNQ